MLVTIERRQRYNMIKFLPNILTFTAIALALPLISINLTVASQIRSEDFTLEQRYTFSPTGAYRLKLATFGASRVAYTPGAIAISKDENSVYIASHDHHFSIGSFDLSRYSGRFGSLEDIPLSPNKKPFTSISPPLRPQATANRITGIYEHEDSLLVTVDEYYDANGDNQENLLIIDKNSDLSESSQLGYYPVNGQSHVAGWINQLPPALSKAFNASHYMGSSSRLPINSRLSIGPSLFIWNAPTYGEAPPVGRKFHTKRIIDYSIHEPLHADLYNTSKKNNLWTELSYAATGFFAPSTNDYIVIGRSGGHESGIGYKIRQSNGNLCGGPCAYQSNDYYNYYWIYKNDDILASHRGDISPSELVPYAYGKLPNLLNNSAIIGGDYNSSSSTLYLLLGSADKLQSKYESSPVLLSFKVSTQ